MKKIVLFLVLTFSTLLAERDLEQALRLYEGNKFAKAYELFGELCEKENSKACFSAAYMSENAQGIPRDLKKAYKFYDKACTLGLAKACSNLALLLKEQGYENEAILAFNRGCKLSDTASCNAVALFYENEQDGDLALSFYKKSCSLKDGKACYKLGSIYEKGELVRQNLTSSISFYTQSCSFGYAEACYLLGRYNEKEKKDMAKAKRYFGMACDKKHKEACEAYKEFVKKGIEIY